MDPVKLVDEHRKKIREEQMSQLKEIKAELQKFKAERLLPGAKVTDGDPNKLAEIEKLRPLLEEVSRKHKAALEEAYKKKREHIPIYIRHRITRFITSSL